MLLKKRYHPFCVRLTIFLCPLGDINIARAFYMRAFTDGGRRQVLGYPVRPGFEPASPSTEKQADGLSYLLHSVLRLGSCQWNWVVAGATAAFDWSLMVTVRLPNPM